jgi:hypothetical protein
MLSAKDLELMGIGNQSGHYGPDIAYWLLTL